MSCYGTRRLAVVWFLVLLAFAARTQATSVAFTPLEDATITEKSLNNSIGDEQTIEISTTGPSAGFKSSRALLRFHLAGGIPTNAIVTAAALTLRLDKTAPAVTNLWADLHRVLRSWDESQVAWSNRLSLTPWSAPGAAAPVDFVRDVTQSNLITTTLGPYTFASNARMVADVQDWVRNPGGNWGWIMISELQGVGQTETKFNSREASSAAARPSLAVEYFIPATPPTVTVLAPTNGSFRFRFNAASNRSYVVEYSGALPTTNWKVLTSLGPLPGSTNILTSDLITESNRFYRVRTP